MRHPALTFVGAFLALVVFGADQTMATASKSGRLRGPAAAQAQALSVARTFVEVELGELKSPIGLHFGGTRSSGRAGYSVASAGDFNGDGTEDVIVGLPRQAFGSLSPKGCAVILFGKPGVNPSAVDFPPASGVGITIYGARDAGQFGESVAGGGDINGDGFDDVIVTEPAPLGAATDGKVYVIYGRAGTADIDAPTVASAGGFVLAAPDNQYMSVAGNFDINGDGFSDVAIATPKAIYSGVAVGSITVVYGKATSDAKNLALDSITSPDGFQQQGFGGLVPAYNIGLSIASAGDFTGDGYDDLLATYKFGSDIIVRTRVSIIAGGKALRSTPGAIDFEGLALNSEIGRGVGDTRETVSGGGDVNGDGVADIVIGQPSAWAHGMAGNGVATVVYGGRRMRDPQDLADIGAGTGFHITGEAANDHMGASVRIIRDVNGDGLDDVIVAAPDADLGAKVNAGAAYVVFGRRTSQQPLIVDLRNLAKSDGFYINGYTAGALSGFSTATAGDFNKDGFGDILLGSPAAAPAGVTKAGAGHIVFGSAVGPIDRTGTADNDFMPGSSGDDKLNGATGDDTIRGNGGDDVLIGGPGRDLITGGSGSDTFVYRSVLDSVYRSRMDNQNDTIVDFKPAFDQIDLSRIDANTVLSGNQAFTFIGTNAFTGPGQVRAVKIDKTGTANDQTEIYANVDANPAIDFRIILRGLISLHKDNFIP